VIKYRLALVEYLNTFPFSEGMKLAGLDQQIDVQRVSPATCATLFQSGQVDISLCPVGALEDMPGHEICSDYCIGADGDVDTVMLLSQVPMHQIEKVRLDPNSKTSNKLVQVLTDRYWKVRWKFYHDTKEEVPTSCVMIGDKVFDQKKNYPIRYDLAGAWKSMTGLPMVFAVWIARPDVPPEVIQQLNDAFKMGVDNIATNESLQDWQKKYLLKNISYPFDRRKKEAMELFLQYAGDLVPLR
jgi:chorismate dehydratase